MHPAVEKALHRAPLVLPVAGPPIENGGVLTQNGRILAVGRFSDLKGQEKQVIDHDETVLMPALVNAHAHLELSYLADLGQSEGEPLSDLTEWIGRLLQTRATCGATEQEIGSAAAAAGETLRETGTLLVADIGNRLESARLISDQALVVQFYWELLGLTQSTAQESLQLLSSLDPEVQCTAHASYSTAAVLIQALKKRASNGGHLFPIHVAESPAEQDFLRDGSGPLRSFLEARDGWDGSFAPPGSGAVEYLDRLGVLDSRTLCVHCVHVSGTEIGIFAKRQARICLCPGSNRFLQVGKAPVPQMLAAGLLPALGTDSLASNPLLNLWREMRLLREDHPDIDPEEVLVMATRGGAEALGVGEWLGSLAPGKTSRMLGVSMPPGASAHIYDFLTTSGEEATIEWLE